MLGATELGIHRANTLLYIGLDPTDIILIPIDEVWAAGTKKLVPQTPRDPQTFHVIWPPETGIVGGGGFGGSGITYKFDFMLIGPWDAVVAINDRWDSGTQRNVINYIFPSNGYELKCGGVSFGSKPDA